MHNQLLVGRALKIQWFLFYYVEEVLYPFSIKHARNEAPEDIIICCVFVSSQEFDRVDHWIRVWILLPVEDIFELLVVLPFLYEILCCKVLLKGQVYKVVISVFRV